MKLEERYIVLKLKRLTKYEISQLKRHYPEAMVKSLVVEHDWPEYPVVLKMISDRVDGKPNELESLRTQLAIANQKLNKSQDDVLSLNNKLSEAIAQLCTAEAEKAELVRQCLGIVGRYDPDTDDALGAYVSRNAVYDEILSLLPKGK